MVSIINRFKTLKKNYTGLISAVALINILLAVFALIKDIMFAYYMGTSSMSDAILLSFFIVDMIGNSLLSTTLWTSCVPLFSRLYVKEKYNELRVYIFKINIYSFILCLIVSFFIFIQRDAIIGLAGTGLSSQIRELSIVLLIILLPSIPLFSVMAIGIAANNVFGNFSVISFAPILFNFLFFAGTIMCIIFNVPQHRGVYIIAGCIVTGILSMVVLLYIYVWEGFRKLSIEKVNKFRFGEFLKRDENLLGIIKLFMPYFVIVLLPQIVMFIERNLASQFGPGIVASLNYGYRVAQFPVMVFATAIGTVTYPMMSKAVEEGDYNGLKIIFKKSIKLTLVFTIPVVVLLYFCRREIITILFVRGAFDINSLYATSQILAGYAFATLGQGVTAIFLKLFLVLRKATVALIVLMFTTTINILADYYLAPRIGIMSLGLGAFVASLLSILLFICIFRKYVKLS